MHEPPRLVERLLRRLLPRGPRGDALLGDLREEYDHGCRAGLRAATARRARPAQPWTRPGQPSSVRR